jgi:8-oxo-dGTP diphosphatase
MNYTSVDQIEWDAWRFTETAVLCFVQDNDRILLIHKKTGLGKGKINAPGGRIASGERAVDAAVRESEEETGITPVAPWKVGELHFIFTDGYSLHGSVFWTKRYTGYMRETDEADPFWCRIDELPWERMWEDDAFWLPSVLDGYFIRGYFIFDSDTMLSRRIETERLSRE